MKKESVLSKKIRASILVPIALTALLAISSNTFAHEDHKGCRWESGDKGVHSEMFQKRQNALHEKLALTSNQEPAWNQYVSSTKPNEMDKKDNWSESSKLTTPERLDKMLSRTKEREAQIEKRVSATKEFYGRLTPTQQKTFDASFEHREHHNHQDKEGRS